MDRFSSMLRVVCTRLCAVLMDHELDARPNKLMLKKKRNIYHNSSSSISIWCIYRRASMHAYASSGTVTPTFTSTLQKRWTARSYSSPKLSRQQFFFFLRCQVAKTIAIMIGSHGNHTAKSRRLWATASDVAEAICMRSASSLLVLRSEPWLERDQMSWFKLITTSRN